MAAQLTIEERIAAATAKVGPPRSVYDDAPPRRRSIAARFAEFHAANPHIYAEIVKMARRARARGAERIGIKMLWEALRWQLAVETGRVDGDTFRLNNVFTAHYARLVMEQEPDLRGIFETRERKAA